MRKRYKLMFGLVCCVGGASVAARTRLCYRLETVHGQQRAARISLRLRHSDAAQSRESEGETNGMGMVPPNGMGRVPGMWKDRELKWFQGCSMYRQTQSSSRKHRLWLGVRLCELSPSKLP
ncbi:hypothetical protein K431DRAFT_25278 [Polychaeton citri CBS 116435]|uniref:Uncharacterized protein n=1 Tax=Polychaeton citri CBS 116435 TaxID=1314669 RepID=A0A9P4PYM7_9PEZI|nr:hypothetical protein K431DRAFT_25278 [Polychaeton citri CBS 116435]